MNKPRWELKIGSPVMVADGKYGRLKQVILDPHQEQVVALLVQRHGLGTSHTIVVPEGDIANASEHKVRLKISREQADGLPECGPDNALVVEDLKYEAAEESFAVRGRQGMEIGCPPTAQRPGMLEDQLTTTERARLALGLRAGHQVFCKDGHAGKVSHLLLNQKGQVIGFVMHAGHLTGHNLIVPVAWVQDVDRENVHLSVEKRAMENLAEYSPDLELMMDVDKAIWADEILRDTDYNEIDVKVESGFVILQGHVVTNMNRLRAENAALSVSGVLGLTNHLVVDDDLVRDVARALCNDNRTHLEGVYVGAQKGVVTLNGRVSSATVRESAEEVAASVPQVRGVVNFLNAPHGVVNLEEQRVLEPPIGRGIYATDMLLGHVERVIINPHNRRVTAFVALADFTELLHSEEDGSLEERPQEERRVVIPICVVEYETDSSVSLAISGSEAAQFPEFNPVDFVSPLQDWQPPYPYHLEDVLFERKNK
jgi:osmotically-inducible protein OsmY/sporulation protein YlmC with PRC-barrel domain